MRIFEWEVSGGSPGINGRIVVLANLKRQAERLALEEVESMNVSRRLLDGNLVYLGALLDCRSIKLPGVVYSHSGEE